MLSTVYPALTLNVSLHDFGTLFEISFPPTSPTMGVQTMFPSSLVKPVSQYSYGADLGRVKTGFGPFTGTDLAVSPLVQSADGFEAVSYIAIDRFFAIISKSPHGS